MFPNQVAAARAYVDQRAPEGLVASWDAARFVPYKAPIPDGAPPIGSVQIFEGNRLVLHINTLRVGDQWRADAALRCADVSQLPSRPDDNELVTCTGADQQSVQVPRRQIREQRAAELHVRCDGSPEPGIGMITEYSIEGKLHLRVWVAGNCYTNDDDGYLIDESGARAVLSEEHIADGHLELEPGTNFVKVVPEVLDPEG